MSKIVVTGRELQLSPGVRKLNPHLKREFLGFDLSQVPELKPLETKKRIRQSSKPLSNKLETEFGAWLHGTYPVATIAEQAVTFRLANGVKYTPDWTVFGNKFIGCFEVKGKHTWDDAIVKVKVAASLYPDISWLMVWKLNGEWVMQSVLP